MKKSLLVIVALVAIAFGCYPTGTGPSGPGDDDDDNNTITVEHAGTTASALVSSAATGGGFFDFPHDLFTNGCLQPSGDGSDPDGDGIPTLVTVAVDCTIPSADNTTTEIAGSIFLVDPNPLPGFDFQATYSLSAIVKDSSGIQIASGSIQTGIDGSLVGLDFSIDVFGEETVLTNVGGLAVPIVKTHGWSIQYAPTSVWAPGQTIANGAMEISGGWNIQVSDESTETAVLFTNTPLTVNPACGRDLFDGGNIDATWTDGQGAVQILTVNYTGCGTQQADLNGEAKTILDASRVPLFSF